MRSPRGLLVFVVLVVVMAACADGESEQTGGAVSGGDAEAPVEAAGNDEGGTDDTTAAISGDSGSDWCDAVRAAADETDNPLDFDLIGLSPEQVEAHMKANLEELERWEATAPPEIETQVGTLVDSYRTFVSLGDGAEWDLFALAEDPDFEAALDSDEITRAADDVDTYSRDVCGVDLGVDPTEDGTAGVTDPGDAADMATIFLEQFGLPANFLTDGQLECLNEQLAAAYPEGMPEDLTLTADNVEIFDTAGAACGIGN